MKQVLMALPKKEVIPKAIVKKMISLEEMIERFTERVQTSLKMSFSDFAKTQSTANSGAKHSVDRSEKVNIIVFSRYARTYKTRNLLKLHRTILKMIFLLKPRVSVCLDINKNVI